MITDYAANRERPVPTLCMSKAVVRQIIGHDLLDEIHHPIHTSIADMGGTRCDWCGRRADFGEVTDVPVTEGAGGLYSACWDCFSREDVPMVMMYTSSDHAY